MVIIIYTPCGSIAWDYVYHPAASVEVPISSLSNINVIHDSNSVDGDKIWYINTKKESR
jgi:hypothetical protein